MMTERQKEIMTLLREWLEEYFGETEAVEQSGLSFLRLTPALFTDGTGRVLMEICLLDYSEEITVAQVYSTVLPKLGTKGGALREWLGEWNLKSLAGSYGIYEEQGQFYHKQNIALINSASADDQVEFLFTGICLAMDEMARRMSDNTILQPPEGLYDLPEDVPEEPPVDHAAWEQARQIMQERFGHDTLIALATSEGTAPCVRTVNAYCEDGSFYIITNAKSGKMRQIARNSAVAISGDWFTAQGVGEDLGHILAPEHAALAATLREQFASWYGNGHVNENDPETHILRVRLTRGTLMSHGTRYEIDFVNGVVTK